MKTLKDFAHFIRSEYLEQFAREYVDALYAMDVPLLKLFTHLTPEEFFQTGLKGSEEFLVSIEEGTAVQRAKENLIKWEKDELPGVPKNSIHPSDLVLIYAAQKKPLIQLLSKFTKDVVEATSILLELESYYNEIQNNAILMLFKLQKEAENEAKRHQEELKVKNLLLDEVQHLAQIGSYNVLLKDHTVQWSDEMYKLNEIEIGTAIIYEDIEKNIHPEDRERVKLQSRQTVEQGIPLNIYYRLLFKDGRIKTLHARGEVERDEDGEPLRFIGSVQDVTEMINTRNELEKQNQLLEEAQHLAKLGYWEWDIKKDTLNWSNELMKLYEIEPGSVHLNYETYFGFVHPEDKSILNNEIQAAVREKKPLNIYHKIITGNNNEKTMHTRGEAFYDINGEPIRMRGTSQDVTDLFTEKKLNDQKSEFIGIASHELKTPLTSIKAYMQLLERSIEKKDDRTLVEKANKHINKLNELISELLDVSKIEAGKLQLNITEFKVDTFIKETIESVQHSTPTHKIIREGSLGDSKIKGDKSRLEQVLVNYVTNAVKYSPKSDKVLIKVIKEDNNVVVAVTDFGIGIPKDKQGRIFERFYRVEGLAPTYQGLGIGLFISSEIIKRHKGRTWVESKEGEGSTFYFSLPLLEE